MSGELVKFNAAGLPANPEDLVKGLQNVVSNVQAGGGTPFLRLLRSGLWVYGAENIEVQEGSQWAVNPASLQHGWACWGDGELLGEAMVPFNQPLPAKNTLPDYGEDWSQQLAVQLQCLTGEDVGVQVLYKGTSLGLRTAIRELISALIGQLQRDPANCVPVVRLEVDSYTHKKYGEVFTPVLEIVRWISFSGEPAKTASDDRAELPPANDDDDAPWEDDAQADAQADEPAQAAASTPPAARSRRRRRAPVSEAATTENAPPAAGESAGGAAPAAGGRRRRRPAA